MGGRKHSSLRELLEMGREFERGRKLDERYSYLTRKKTERVADIKEIDGQKSSQGAGKSKKKTKQTNLPEKGSLEVAAAQENGQIISQTAQQSRPEQSQNQ